MISNYAYDSDSLFFLHCSGVFAAPFWKFGENNFFLLFSLDYSLTLSHFQVYKYEKDILELYVVKRRKQEENQTIPFTFHSG